MEETHTGETEEEKWLGRNADTELGLVLNK